MNNTLNVTINSFSYHNSGIPTDKSGNNGGFVFDCRFLPNPGRQEQYKLLTGKDKEVIQFFEEHPIMSSYLNHVKSIVDMAITNYLERGFTHLQISFGCTGGQHRSVYCAESLFSYLKDRTINTHLKHIELEKL